MAAVWPPTLPQFQFSGFDEISEPNVAEFEVDNGPLKKRRRSTKEKQYVRIMAELTGAEVAIFETFWSDTIAHGVTSFEWDHPRTDATAEFRFIQKPKWKQIVPAADPDDRVYRGALELEVL